MSLRKLALVVVLLSVPASRPARADVALGGFFGDPTGVDLLVGVGRRAHLDVLVGYSDFRYFGGAGYGHLTYLLTPLLGRGESVLIPLRLGIGVGFWDGYQDRFGNNHFDVGVRFPLEVGLRFRSVPLEIYGELALVLFAYHDDFNTVWGQGGVGLRFFF